MKGSSPLARVGIVALALATVMLPAPASAESETVFTFEGGGWGHGTGMSQYGAQGMALAGHTWEQILGHYFTGVGLEPLQFDPGPADLGYEGPVWVGLDQNLTSVAMRVRAIGPDPTHVRVTRGTEVQDIFAGNTITISFADGQCTFSVQDTTWPPGPCEFDLDWDGWSDNPTLMLDTTLADEDPSCDQPGERCYSRGSLMVRPNEPAGTAPTGFHLVARVNLEHYLYGIYEVPYSWDANTLKAQAVAARSYAANKQALRGKPIDSPLRQQLCWCQVYDSVRDQHYVGWGRGEQSWIDAVNETQYVVMTHPEVAAPASHARPGAPMAVGSFYSSSTFGHTEDSGVAFGSGFTPSYLQGVADPWSVDPAVGNPNASWSKEMRASAVAAAVGMEEVTSIDVASWLREGTELQTAHWITFNGVDNGAPASKSFPANELRSKLSLLSMQITSISAYTPTPVIETGRPRPPMQFGVGMQNPERGLWSIRYGPDSSADFYYGIPSDAPLACDWDGDHTSTVGLYRPVSGFMYLRNSNDFGVADTDFFFGIKEDIPVCGDWDGDGIDTIGIFRPSERKFYLRNTNDTGFADIEFAWPGVGDVPVAGDWDGDGTDSVGTYDPAGGKLQLTNSNEAPAIDVDYDYNTIPEDLIVTGDWDGDGVDSVGVYRPEDATFYLRDTFTQPHANHVIEWGTPGWMPVAGVWSPTG